MKKIWILLMTGLLLSGWGRAQNISTGIRGKIIDEKNLPVEVATVSIMKQADSTLVKMTVSGKEGLYSFAPVPAGSYFIQVSAIGHLEVQTPAFVQESGNLSKQMAPITLKSDVQSLSGVTIVAKRAPIELKADRMVINVEGSLTSSGSTAMEVLERSPGVSVDQDGNIRLNGKPNVTVMIDGKPAYLNGANLAGLLGSMNAEQLSQIEIMTQPPAGYDAAGNAGVINIKTKKNTAQGFNGNISVGFAEGRYPKSNNNLMLNYRRAKFNLFLNYGYSFSKSYVDVNVERNFINPDGHLSYSLGQVTHLLNTRQNNNLKVGLDYSINPRTTVGFVVSGFVAPQDQSALTTSRISDSLQGLTSTEKTNRSVQNTWNNGTLNLNFRSGFNDPKNELTGNLDYLHYNFSGNQLNSADSYDSKDQLKGTSYLRNNLPLTIDVYDGRLDYTQTLGSGLKLETGIKASSVRTGNTSLFYTGALFNQLMDSLNNSFTYKEDLNAAYLSVSRQLGNWEIQAGLRAESTQYQGNETTFGHGQDSSFHGSYTKIFPTVFVQYSLSDENKITLSAGRRIDRPAYQQLNPFVSYIDQYMRMSGNPYLQPQISNSLELSHQYKNQLISTLSYSVIHQMINETMIQNDSVITRTIGNIGTRYNVGWSEAFKFRISSWYTGTAFTNLYDNIYDGNVNGYPFQASQLTLEVNLNNQFNFPGGWSAELSGHYSTRSRDEGQAIAFSYGQVAAGVSKKMLNSKATLKLSVRDLFKTAIPREIQDFQNVQSTLLRSMDTRVVSLAFTYQFGNPLKQKSTPATEEQQRIQLN